VSAKSCATGLSARFFRVFKTIDASFNRDESFILPGSHYHHVRQLLKRSLDFGYTLINIVQFNTHAVVSTRPCDDHAERRQNVTVVDRGVEHRLATGLLEATSVQEKPALLARLFGQMSALHTNWPVGALLAETRLFESHWRSRVPTENLHAVLAIVLDLGVGGAEREGMPESKVQALDRCTRYIFISRTGTTSKLRD
jgi:hypothetical protein